MIGTIGSALTENRKTLKGGDYMEKIEALMTVQTICMVWIVVSLILMTVNSFFKK